MLRHLKSPPFASALTGLVTSNSRPLVLPAPHDSSAVRYPPHGAHREASPETNPCVPGATIVTVRVS